MSKESDSFARFVVEDLFSAIPAVRANRMFGGYGIYQRDLMFALIAADRLYMKVDDALQSEYESMGCEPFSYEGGNKKSVMISYWSMPAEGLEQREEAMKWAERSIAAATKLRKPKPRAQPKAKPKAIKADQPQKSASPKSVAKEASGQVAKKKAASGRTAKKKVPAKKKQTTEKKKSVNAKSKPSARKSAAKKKPGKRSPR
ncbi:MAG: TfoX/Sxy family protein [Leptospiraceae bacterium]|nr:TfoX/Sxy family protein [Leptospiraceae bacterium]MCB1303076.1 TfoX/Sxy family protein [Leptospiraceae bacterium]